MPNGMEGATSGDFAWAEASDNRKALKELQERVKSLEEDVSLLKRCIHWVNSDFTFDEIAGELERQDKNKERIYGNLSGKSIRHHKMPDPATEPQFLSKPYDATKLGMYWWNKSLEEDFNFEEGTKLLGCWFSGTGREDMSIFCIEDNTFEINATKEHPGHIGIVLKIHEPSKGVHIVYSTVTL